MSPWTEKLERFTAATGLKRFNTLHLTWPMRWGKVPLLPLVAIDNVFASPPFAKIATQGGPRLGSDHGRSSPTSRLLSLPSLEP